MSDQMRKLPSFNEPPIVLKVQQEAAQLAEDTDVTRMLIATSDFFYTTGGELVAHYKLGDEDAAAFEERYDAQPDALHRRIGREHNGEVSPDTIRAYFVQHIIGTLVNDALLQYEHAAENGNVDPLGILPTLTGLLRAANDVVGTIADPGLSLAVTLSVKELEGKMQQKMRMNGKPN